MSSSDNAGMSWTLPTRRYAPSMLGGDVYQCPPVSLNLARTQHPGVGLSVLRATNEKQFTALLSSWAHHLQLIVRRSASCRQPLTNHKHGTLQAADNAAEVSELKKLIHESREQLETAQFRATEADTRLGEVQTEVQGLRSRLDSAERKEQVWQQCTIARDQRFSEGLCGRQPALVHGLQKAEAGCTTSRGQC